MKITHAIEILNSPEKVFYWLENPDCAMQWMENVTKSEIINQTPDMVGTTFREYVEEGGQGTELQGVITDFNPNKRLAFHLEGDFNSVDVSFVLEEKGENTQLTQRAEVRFKGKLKVIGVLLHPFLKWKLKKQIQGEFSDLKKLCEDKKLNV